MPRHFGLGTLTALVVANMIGAGVFTTSGFALVDLGTPQRVIAAWIVGAAIALCGAYSYGQLSRRIVGSGGEYLFLSRAIHPLAGFLAGWVSLLAGFTSAIAFAATAIESYALPDAIRPAWLPHDAIAIGVVVLAGLLHGLRARSGAIAQNAIVALKVLMLFAFVGVAAMGAMNGSWPGPSEQLVPPPFSMSAFAISLVWISLSYSGFNAAVYVAGEARSAERTVPRALLLGTVIVSLLYIALNFIFVFATDIEAVKGQTDIAAIAARAVGGRYLEFAARAVIIVALLTSVSSMIMAGPRVYAKMADDGLLPESFKFKGATPQFAVFFQVALAAIIILAAEMQQLLSYLGFTLSLSAAATVACLFILNREAKGSLFSLHLVPAGFFVSATFALAAMAALSRPFELLATAITVLTGAVAFYAIFYGTNRKRIISLK